MKTVLVCYEFTGSYNIGNLIGHAAVKMPEFTWAELDKYREKMLNTIRKDNGVTNGEVIFRSVTLLDG